MQKQREVNMLASLLASFPKMTDEDRAALVAFAKASVRDNPRPLSSTRQFFRCFGHPDDLSSALRRAFRK